MMLVLGVAFFYFVLRPLWHTDLWGHLSYGRYLHETQALPETEPLMPLCSGVPFVDTAWLSQVIGYEAIRTFGVPAIQFLYAASVTLCLALIMWRVYRRTQSAVFSLVACGLFLWIDWQQFIVVRPQLGGLVCFIALFVLLTTRQWSKVGWVVIPLLFVLWANLHGSFPIGLAMLGAFCVGRGCDVLRRTDRFSAIIDDRDFRRYLLLTELAAVAVLLNPYGIGLYAEVWSIARHANLTDIREWEPLTLRMKQAQAAALVGLALVMLYRVSPRRVTVAEILLLSGLGGGAMWTSRMIVWWAPIAGYFVAVHGYAAWKQIKHKRREKKPAPRGLFWTAVCAATVVLCVAVKPLEPLLSASERALIRSRLSRGTPVRAVEYLRKNPPPGQIFNAYEWGDYLLWAGPKNVQVFVASHAHFVPREVWQSYMQVINLSSGWEETLERFGANTVLIDKTRRRALTSRLRRNDDWEVAFEDNRAVVFRRMNPI